MQSNAGGGGIGVEEVSTGRLVAQHRGSRHIGSDLQDNNNNNKQRRRNNDDNQEYSGVEELVSEVSSEVVRTVEGVRGCSWFV